MKSMNNIYIYELKSIEYKRNKLNSWYIISNIRGIKGVNSTHGIQIASCTQL